MATATRNIDMIVRAKDEASGVFEKINAAAKRMNQESRQSGELALERLLKGGGAFGLLNFAGESLNKFTEKAQEIREKMAHGMGGGEAADELAKSLPVLGHIYEAGRRIHDLLSGEAEDVARINEESKRAEEYVEAQRRAVEAYKKSYDELRLSIRASHQEEARIGLEGQSGQAASLRDKMMNAREDAPKAMEKGLEEIRKRRSAELLKIGAEIDAITLPDEKIAGIAGQGFAQTTDTDNPAYAQAVLQLQKLNEQRNRLLKQQHADEEGFTKQFQAEQTATEEKTQKELEQISFEAAVKHAKEAFDAESNITAILAAADRERQDLAAQNRQADLDSLKAALNAQVAEIDRASEERNAKFSRLPVVSQEESTANDKANEQARRLKDALAAKFQQDAAATNRTHDDADASRRNREIDAEREFQERLTKLKGEALGMRLRMEGKDYDAAKLKLREDFEQEQANLDRNLRAKIQELRAAHGPDTDAKAAALREAAEAERAGQGELYRQRQRALLGEYSDKASDYRGPSLVEGAHLTGAGAASAENNMLSLAQSHLDALKSLIANTAKTNDKLDQMRNDGFGEPASVLSGGRF